MSSVLEQDCMNIYQYINFNGRRFWLFYNAIGAVAQCPNNWGVGSVFPTLENTYFIGPVCLCPVAVSCSDQHFFETQTHPDSKSNSERGRLRRKQQRR